MDGFIVEEDSVSLLAMLAQALTVIGSNNNERAVVQLLHPQNSDQLSCGSIRRGHCGIVGSAGRSFRIIQMHPQKKRAFRIAGKPGCSPSGDLRC